MVFRGHEREERFNFTHCVAVHEEDAKGFPTFVFQAEEERIVSVEVMGSLQGQKTDRQGKDKNHSHTHLRTHTFYMQMFVSLSETDLLTPFGKPSLVKMGQVLQSVLWRYCLCTCSPRP